MAADEYDPDDFSTDGELSAAGTTGGKNYRCTRGGCGDVIGHPVNQDAHNQSKHVIVRAADHVVDAITKGISGESGMQTGYEKNLDARSAHGTQTLWDDA